MTFNTPKIPDSLKICYLNIPVSQYVPNPIRCYKCQRFGHVTGTCKHSETCARCSETGHKDDTCINVLTVEKAMHRITKSAVIIRGNLIFNISEYQKMYIFSKLVQFIKNSWTEGDE